MPGNFYARRRFSSSTSSSASSSFLFIFVSQLSLAPSLSYSRKFAANLDFCIFISSGFGFNVVPRKLPKFNRVNDKVFSLLSLLCLPFLFFLFFSTLHYKQQRENEMKRKRCWHNKKDNDNKRCEQKLRSRQVLNLASVQSWPFDALFK